MFLLRFFPGNNVILIAAALREYITPKVRQFTVPFG